MAKKLGLCFTGGGARGAYQIGAAQALKELGILDQIQVYSGTSIGAANAAVLASSSVKTTKEIWFNIPKDALHRDESIMLRLTKEKLKMIDHGIYKMDTFENVMMSEINYERLKTKEIYVTISEGGEDGKGIFDLVKSTYNHYIKKDSKVIYLPLQELTQLECHKAIVASCSIPVIFPAVSNENKKYYDGGVFDNIPVRPLVDAGCDEIIIVHLNRIVFFKTEKYPQIVFHEIKHKGSLGGVLDFNNEHSQKIYDYGYQDTMTYFTKNK
ncbi:MAG: patatin-like phospholipase family protein [Bacillota bacterium]